ncbi:MAG: bifunctional 5,10-methylene-tetrahydrofolate dehydrogenase/5,10-methylene-tetrahydrofolate cyclohydrolase [Clostridia bacterium]|nr:bifunctional 5,10-methylene-tetrahydrofolate dehydrogenase/5,10-methylene-tetrahydrofolate cyclohydrolase [Clostridia bacterium]
MARLLEGKPIAAQIREETKAEVARLREQGIVPKMAAVLVGDDPASVVYANSKKKASSNVGIDYELFTLPGDASESQVLELIDKLNSDPSVHGIMVELPLPAHIDKQKVLEAVRPDKDVDGSHPINRGYILSGQDGLFPATPQSCVEILVRSGIEIEGKRAVIVGRGETVGKPLVFLLLKYNPTITICHSRTRELGSVTREGDILIAAVGKPRMIKADMIKPGAVVIDAGINEVDGGICGDVDFEEAKEVAGAITPVPGGVGSLTTVLILRNVLKGIRKQLGKG